MTKAKDVVSMDWFSKEFQERSKKAKKENDHCYINEKYNVLLIKTGVPHYEYDIALSRCRTAGACLDWIHQVNGKTWATPELMKDFISLLFNNIDSNLWTGKS